MNNIEINRILKRVCGDTFLGVYARNQLPRITKKPALLVVNTDAAGSKGRHWLAMYFDSDGTGELFDSLAMHIHRDFNAYMNMNCNRWITNKRQLQSVVSRFCGAYTVIYCAYRYKGLNINAICKMYTNDYGYNDVITHEIVCRRLNK